MKIGLVGAGMMGHGIAGRLLGAGHALTVIAHRSRSAVDDLVARGASEVTSLAGLAAAGELVIVCVSDSKAVEAVVAGLEPGLAKGAMVLDMGTSDPASSRALAARLQGRGVAFAEAPVAGGPEQARDGVLGAMVGADEETFARLAPVLAACCARVSHMGPVGAGGTAKLISNFLVCGMIGLIADSFDAARQAGIDWRKLYEVMQQGSGNSGALKKMIDPALSGDFDGYRFSIANAAKDLGYYLKLAGELGLDADLAVAAHAVFAEAVARGEGGRNVSRLLEPRTTGD